MKTEQCFCKSYYDDDGILQDCTCGKCGESYKKNKDWEAEFDEKFPHRIKQEYAPDKFIQGNFNIPIKDFISQEIKLALEAQRKEIRETIKNMPTEYPDYESNEFDQGAKYFKDNLLKNI